MGLEARRRAEARYSWDVIVDEMLAAYEAVDHFGVSRTAFQIWRFLLLWLFG